MRTKQELKGKYFQKFEAEGDNQEDLRNAISESGLHCCDNCGYITDELVRFKDYDFTKEKVLATMKEAGQPLNAGKIAELSGLDRKEVDAAMKQLKAEGAIVSPVRCKWAPAE